MSLKAQESSIEQFCTGIDWQWNKSFHSRKKKALIEESSSGKSLQEYQMRCTKFLRKHWSGPFRHRTRCVRTLLSETAITPRYTYQRCPDVLWDFLIFLQIKTKGHNGESSDSIAGTSHCQGSIIRKGIRKLVQCQHSVVCFGKQDKCWDSLLLLLWHSDFSWSQVYYQAIFKGIFDNSIKDKSLLCIMDSHPPRCSRSTVGNRQRRELPAIGHQNSTDLLTS